MNRKSLFGALAALMIAGTGTYTLAQTAPPPPPPAGAAAPGAHPGMQHMHKWDKKDGKHGMRNHAMRGHGHMRGHARGPGGAVISDLAKLQRIYAMQGKSSEMSALYQHVLSSTQNQDVRNFAYAQMARAQMRPGDTSAAVATLRKSLDENLTALNKQQEMRMQMHERMQQKAK